MLLWCQITAWSRLSQHTTILSCQSTYIKSFLCRLVSACLSFWHSEFWSVCQHILKLWMNFHDILEWTHLGMDWRKLISSWGCFPNWVLWPVLPFFSMSSNETGEDIQVKFVLFHQFHEWKYENCDNIQIMLDAKGHVKLTNSIGFSSELC